MLALSTPQHHGLGAQGLPCDPLHISGMSKPLWQHEASPNSRILFLVNPAHPQLARTHLLTQRVQVEQGKREHGEPEQTF